MNLFTPDDFRNDPYTAGLNQIGHGVLGACVAILLFQFIPYTQAVILGGLGIITWEALQLHLRGAIKSDYWADLFFWAMGLFLFQWVFFLHLLAAAGFGWMLFMDYKYGR